MKPIHANETQPQISIHANELQMKPIHANETQPQISIHAKKRH